MCLFKHVFRYINYVPAKYLQLFFSFFLFPGKAENPPKITEKKLSTNFVKIEILVSNISLKYDAINIRFYYLTLVVIVNPCYI